MTTARVAIDLNIRVRGNQTYAGYEDVEGVVMSGSLVEVWEPESEIAGVGIVTSVDARTRLVYLAVDWTSMKPGGTPRSPAVTDGNIGSSRYRPPAIHPSEARLFGMPVTA